MLPCKSNVCSDVCRISAASCWTTSAGSRPRFPPNFRIWSTPSLTARSRYQSAKSQVQRNPSGVVLILFSSDRKQKTCHCHFLLLKEARCLRACLSSRCRSRGEEAHRVPAGQRAEICRRGVGVHHTAAVWRSKLPFSLRVTTVSLIPQDGSAAHPDLSGVLSVCQRHPIHRHRHADASVGPPQGQQHLSGSARCVFDSD